TQYGTAAIGRAGEVRPACRVVARRVRSTIVQFRFDSTTCSIEDEGGHFAVRIGKRFELPGRIVRIANNACVRIGQFLALPVAVILVGDYLRLGIDRRLESIDVVVTKGGSARR